MKATQVRADRPRSFVLVLDKGDEAVASIEEFARTHDLRGASFTAIGAFSSVTVGYFDRSTTDYETIDLDEQVEVLSMIGDVARRDDEPVAHAHVVLGRRDATTRGGHLMKGRVWPTLELVITEAPPGLCKRLDPQTGLALIDPDLSG